MNDHIIPALKAAFPRDAAIKKHVVVRTCLYGYHGGAENGFYRFAPAERVERRYDRILREMDAARRLTMVYKNSKDWPAFYSFDNLRDVFDNHSKCLDFARNFTNGDALVRPKSATWT